MASVKQKAHCRRVDVHFMLVDRNSPALQAVFAAPCPNCVRRSVLYGCSDAYERQFHDFHLQNDYKQNHPAAKSVRYSKITGKDIFPVYP